MSSKYNGNIELLEFLFKTEQFHCIKDEIIKDSFQAILSLLKYQNDKINQIDNDIFNKITREEFNENLKTKVNYSEFMSQLSSIKDKDTKTETNKLFFPKISNNNIYNEIISSNNKSLDDLNKEIQNLKIEYSMLSKKLENAIIFQEDKFPTDISGKKENSIYNGIKEKLEKNEKDITNLTVEFQNNFLKIDDKINNLKMNQTDKSEINQNINEALKKIEENYTNNIQNEFLEINRNIKKQITDSVIEINKNKIKDENNNPDIKYDLIIKEILSKNNIFDETIKEMNSKFHKKIDKEEIIDIYSNLEEIKNNIIKNKNDSDIKINKILNDINKYIKNENKDIQYKYKIENQEDEIKNIKLNVNENSTLINNLKEELIKIQKNNNNLIQKEIENRNISNFISTLENNNNVYPKNDIKNEISYLKRFINMFMIETKNENRKELDKILNVLNEKINIKDINNILKDINNDMNNKLNIDLFYKHIQIQNDINNFISKEHIIGKWISYSKTPLNNSFILWDQQLINSAPNNFCFSSNNSHIFIKEKGIYLIKIILFIDCYNNNSVNNVQLVLDRKRVYNYSCGKTKMSNYDKINDCDFYEESRTFEECIHVNNICRIEVRLNMSNNFGSDKLINESKNGDHKNNDKIKAILIIKSL